VNRGEYKGGDGDVNPSMFASLIIITIITTLTTTALFTTI